LSSDFSNSPGSRSDGTPTSATPKFISVTDTGPAPLLERGLSDNTASLAYKVGEGSSGMKGESSLLHFRWPDERLSTLSW
jgi:hypothetical protein